MSSFLSSGSASFPGTVSFIANVSAATAGTEYSYALPANTVQFELKSRSSGKLQLAYTNGNTGTTFITLYPGDTYTIQGVRLTDATIYFRSTKDNDIIEIQGFSVS